MARPDHTTIWNNFCEDHIVQVFLRSQVDPQIRSCQVTGDNRQEELETLAVLEDVPSRCKAVVVASAAEASVLEQNQAYGCLLVLPKRC